jgi:flagellar biosynthesis/type III secretory pathway protein FliH
VATAYEFPTLEATTVIAAGGSIAEQAAAIVAAAEAQAEVVIAAAAEQGRAEGHAQGVAEAHELLAPAREALEAGLAALAQERVVAEAEAAAVELALALAQKVLGTALEVRPELVLEVATGALRRTDERDHLVLQVNPDDLELVRASLDEIAGRLGGIGRLEAASERRVARGGCIVRTPDGEIDATISTQLEAAAEVLRESLSASADV